LPYAPALDRYAGPAGKVGGLTAPPGYEGRSPALDGIRGIAILLVLLHHYTVFDPQTPVQQVAAFVAVLGWAGVDLFFVLSGFLITAVLINARDSPRYFTSFYARRTLRLFPLYYLLVFLAFYVLPLFPAWHHLLVGPFDRRQWRYWLYLVNFEISADNDFQHGVLDVAWSLAIEEQFYIVWAVVVWLVSPRALGWLCGAVVVTAPVARIMALGAGGNPIDVYVLPHFRADALAIGALLAWLYRRGDLQSFTRFAPWVAVSGLAVAIVLAIADGTAWWWGAWTQRLGYSAFAAAAGGLVTAAVTRPASSAWLRLLSAGWLRGFGKYSYCLYLIHLPVMRVVRVLVLGPEQFDLLGSPLVGQLLFYLAATAPAVAIAWLSWHLYEGPILRLKKKFSY
jgi:peptidoglycan/LPS O-acetylase OafA/YrhL